MAEDTDNEDRTEEATDERREEFREQGNIAVSREVTSIFVLCSALAFCTMYMASIMDDLKKLFIKNFEVMPTFRVTVENVGAYAGDVWTMVLKMIAPLFFVTIAVAVFVTLLQTRFNWSWKKVQPDFTRLNPLKGLAQMVNMQALANLAKSMAKMLVVGLVAFLVLKGEWRLMPSLLRSPLEYTWSYCAGIIKTLFWSVIGLTTAIATLDFIFSYLSVERKLKMTKQEVKEDYKKREVDPHVKARMRRMQRDMSMGKMLESTKKATVVVMNPTHFAVALQYDLGMRAPVVVAKGKDFNALRIKEVALANDVTVLENPPLARLLYRTCDVGKEIPDSMYKAVSEVIRYVFKLKGRSLIK